MNQVEAVELTGQAGLAEQYDIPNASFLEKIASVDAKCARSHREYIRDVALEIGGYGSMKDALADLGPRTAIAHIAGGVATRWDKSFGQANEYDQDGCSAVRGVPRGLARVPNLLAHEGIEGEQIPVFAYSLWATKEISGARRYIIYPQNASNEDIGDMAYWTEKMGLQAEFRPQFLRGVNLKPSGHADAIVQHADIVGSSVEYFIPQFVSDASSPSTIADTLVVLHAMRKIGISVDMLAPTTPVEGKYPFFINKSGLPVKVGHAKLLGEDSLSSEALQPAESSVGLYLFNAKAFREKMNDINAKYLMESSYAFLSGHILHGPKDMIITNEFAIDDINNALMEEQRVRLLAIAYPREILHSAKAVTDLGSFTQMMQEIIEAERAVA